MSYVPHKIIFDMLLRPSVLSKQCNMSTREMALDGLERVNIPCLMHGIRLCLIDLITNN